MADTTFDLVIERVVPIRAAQLWRGWTDPETLKKWFTPAPWVTSEAEIEARPGGIFRTVMKGPAGEHNEGTGCVLEAVKDKRFVWTSALLPEFVPHARPEDGFFFTAIIEFEPVECGTLYRATVRHENATDAQTHAEIGFEAGWGAALDQLVALFA